MQQLCENRYLYTLILNDKISSIVLTCMTKRFYKHYILLTFCRMVLFSECSLVHHSISILAHMWILSKICKHLIWHLRHTWVCLSIHWHIRHHTRHTKLLLVKSIHHSWVLREGHWESTVGSYTRCVCTTLVRQVLHQLL